VTEDLELGFLDRGLGGDFLGGHRFGTKAADDFVVAAVALCCDLVHLDVPYS